MDLHENLLRGIYAYGPCPQHPRPDSRRLHRPGGFRRDAAMPAGFEKPSAIQQKGIVPFGKGLDVIQQAQSGTGKTATFCAGILQRLDYGELDCQALVLAPTRELAQQIEKVMRALGDYLEVSEVGMSCDCMPASSRGSLCSPLPPRLHHARSPSMTVRCSGCKHSDRAECAQ